MNAGVYFPALSVRNIWSKYSSNRCGMPRNFYLFESEKKRLDTNGTLLSTTGTGRVESRSLLDEIHQW